MDNKPIGVSIEKLGEMWGPLLTQAFVKIATLEGENRRLQERIADLEDEIDRLRPMLPATWNGPAIVRDGNKKAALVDG